MKKVGVASGIVFLVLFLTLFTMIEKNHAIRLFEFYLPWDDSSRTPISLADLIERPAGKYGYVYVGDDGHLYVNGKRIRFLGVNICGSAAFPRKEDAEKIAARLAKFGVNIVRFHHMDASWASPNIFDKSSGGTRKLDPESLDKLDYFIAKLKENGIYVDLNLLVSRRFRASDGLPREVEEVNWKDQQVLGFFVDEILELEKEYARQLLTHRNPYLGTRYAEEPAVAIVEVVNEQGLIHAWLGGVIDRLPEVFKEELREKWNDWLKEKYGSTDKLLKAWGGGGKGLGEELLANGDFSKGISGWSVEVHNGARASYKIINTPEGFHALMIRVERLGSEKWHVQFNYPGIRVIEGRSYLVSFKAKADRETVIFISLRQAHEPWRALSTPIEVMITPEWQDYRIVLLATGSDENARLDITNLGTTEATYYFANFSLREFRGYSLKRGESLEDENVGIFTLKEYGSRASNARRDWVEFLWNLEEKYFEDMYRYLKEELGVKALIIGTIVGCSTPNIMAKLDAVDSHAYWHHPVFPGRPWDPNNWYVVNDPMVNHPDENTISWIAAKRVWGKPFTVSEYNHPAPLMYDAETVLLLATYAALQDWDGIFFFDYGSLNDWDSRRIRGYFDIDQHPAKMASLIPAYMIFVRGDVTPAKAVVSYGLSGEDEMEFIVQGKASSWWLPDALRAGMKPYMPLLCRVGISLNGSTRAPEEVNVSEVYESDNGIVTWNCTDKGRCFILVNSSRTIALIGYIGGRSFRLGDIEVEVGRTLLNGFGVVALTVLDGVSFEDWNRVLVLAIGYTGNTGMQIREYESGRVLAVISTGLDRIEEYHGKVTCSGSWGGAPTLVEGIDLMIKLPTTVEVKAWSLDNTGAKAREVQLEEEGDYYIVKLGPYYRTIWYLLERR